MAIRKIPLIQGEVYHVYNRGAHKADVFRSEADYLRMQILMHICNTDKNIKMSEIGRRYDGNMVDAFSEEVDHSLVDVLAYCLMKNHLHIIVRPKKEGGVQKYMQKVMTGYSMYTNRRHGHSGTIWEGRFKAKYVENDAYLWQLFAYIHVNPVEYMAKFWKSDKTLDTDAALKYLYAYNHSSFVDFYPNAQQTAGASRKESDVLRPQAQILARDDSFTKFLKQFPRPKHVLQYYLEQDFTDL